MNSSVLSFCLDHCFFSACIRKAYYSPALEIDGYIKKRSYTALGLMLQEVFQSVQYAIVFWPVFPLEVSALQSFFLPAVRYFLILSTLWEVLTRCVFVCFLKEARSYFP